jgi:hypothetical protein
VSLLSIQQCDRWARNRETILEDVAVHDAVGHAFGKSEAHASAKVSAHMQAGTLMVRHLRAV